ncbi:hypothetical protein [Trinickia dabaoshanensis]|nr:hypothetical protein [Trinickia dabaoshanensis]
MHIDPDWTFDEFRREYDKAEVEAALHGLVKPPSLSTCQAQWVQLRNIKRLESHFVAGDTQALMLAIALIMQHRLEPPEWVATAYLRAYDDVQNGDANTWDDALGHPFPKGRQPAAFRKERDLVFTVWLAILESQKSDAPPPIDDLLFERIAEQIKCETGVKKLSGSAVKLYYRMAKRTLGPVGGKK